MKILCHSESELETRAIGEALAGSLAPDRIVLLNGDLGAGKTVLTQGIAAGLGIDVGEVQSPTFTLIREHSGAKGDLIHIDLYRLEGEELETLGLWEIFSGPGVKAVEWAERLSGEIPQAMGVDLRVVQPGSRREIEITVNDSERELQTALTAWLASPAEARRR